MNLYTDNVSINNLKTNTLFLNNVKVNTASIAAATVESFSANDTSIGSISAAGTTTVSGQTISFDNVQSNASILNNVTVNNFSTSQMNAATVAIGEATLQEMNISQTAVIAKVNTTTSSIPSLTVSRITINNTQNVAINSEQLETTSAETDNLSVDEIKANTVSSNSQQGTSLEVTGNLSVKSEGIGNVYVSPNEGTFRGIAFFQEVDIGVGSAPLVSMNLNCSGDRVYLRSYNTYLGRIDNGSDFDGSAALLSLSTPGQTTLRYQENGNLAIYQGGTKVWQNGSLISDLRLKKNIRPIESAMDKILKIDGVTFNYNFGSNEQSCGVILEQVEEIFPECVTENLVHLEQLVPLLAAGLKELKERDNLIKAAAASNR